MGHSHYKPGTCSVSKSPVCRQCPGRNSKTSVRPIRRQWWQQQQAAADVQKEQDAKRGHPWLQQVGSTAAACLAALTLLLPSYVQPPPASAVTVEQLLFLEAWRAVDRAYVDKGFNGQSWFRVREKYLKQEKMDNRPQTYAAIRKLLATLDDPFTRLLEPEKLAAVRRGTTGSVTGVGVEVSLDSRTGPDSELVVVAPLPGGPAEAAGVKAGDILLSIGGTATKGLSLYEASDLLLGEEGSEVELLVKTSSSAPRQLTLSRKKLTVVPVSYSPCSSVSSSVGAPGPKLGYIRLATFNSKTAEGTRAALNSAKADGVDSVVLDIRNNGGGLFPAGVQVARQLMPKGDIVLIADASGVRDIYSADSTPLDPRTPLVVLVNKGTASASEVLAGALKDSQRGTITGETTFGKGLIQTIVDLSDGSGLAVTVARYQTPAGVDINRIGIAPDVRLSPEVLALLPTDGPKVCSALSGPEAPRLFK